MSRTARRNWTANEDTLLRQSVQRELDNKRPLLWRELAKNIPGRSNKDCRKRWWNSLAGSTARGAWSAEEDRRLIEAVEKNGTDWMKAAAAVGTRCADQCSGHWRHVLNPNINYSDWTVEEGERLLASVRHHGTNWSTIASFHTPRRTSLALKNEYWRLRQRSGNTSKTSSVRASTPPSASPTATNHVVPPNSAKEGRKRSIPMPISSADESDNNENDDDDVVDTVPHINPNESVPHETGKILPEDKTSDTSWLELGGWTTPPPRRKALTDNRAAAGPSTTWSPGPAGKILRTDQMASPQQHRNDSAATWISGLVHPSPTANDGDANEVPSQQEDRRFLDATSTDGTFVGALMDQSHPNPASLGTSLDRSAGGDDRNNGATCASQGLFLAQLDDIFQPYPYVATGSPLPPSVVPIASVAGQGADDLLMGNHLVDAEREGIGEASTGPTAATSMMNDPALTNPERADPSFSGPLPNRLSHSVSISLSCTTGQLGNVLSFLAGTGIPVNVKIDPE